MEIKTNYNIGDEVWTIQDNAVRKGIIEGIKVYIITTDIRPSKRTFYDLECRYNDIACTFHNVNEELCFPTKQELLDSL